MLRKRCFPTKMKGDTRRVARGMCEMGKRDMGRKSMGYLLYIRRYLVYRYIKICGMG